MQARLRALLKSEKHSRQFALISVLAGKTSVSSSHFPYISEFSFRIVLREIPHLFQDVNAVLNWLAQAERKVHRTKDLDERERESVERAIKVLRNVIYSASICAPPDLLVV